MNKELSKSEKKTINREILKEEIKETNLLTKYFLNTVIFLGSFGFLIVGISSYLTVNIIPFLNASEIIFFPQGITMSIYGTLGLLLSVNQILILYLKIGEGYNKFDKNTGIMEIYRRGFPGNNSDIKLIYPLNDIEALRVEIKNELFNTRQKIFVCIKGKQDIPILQINEPLKIKEIEEKASELASFLRVTVKGI